MGDKFFVVLEDGSRKAATPITRLKLDGKDIEYLYYSIDEDEEPNVSILASRIEVKDNQEVLVDLVDEEERQIAYELFSETYKNLKQEKKNKEENKEVNE
jgi:hypothetical protein